MRAVTVECPRCGRSFSVDPTHIGRRARCKRCARSFELAPTARPPQSQCASETGRRQDASTNTDPERMATPEIPPGVVPGVPAAVGSARSSPRSGLESVPDHSIAPVRVIPGESSQLSSQRTSRRISIGAIVSVACLALMFALGGVLIGVRPTSPKAATPGPADVRTTHAATSDRPRGPVLGVESDAPKPAGSSIPTAATAAPAPASIPANHDVAPISTAHAAPPPAEPTNQSDPAGPSRANDPNGEAARRDTGQLASADRATVPPPYNRRALTPPPSVENLRKSGVFVVLPAEKEVNDAVARLKKLKRDHAAAVSKRHSLEIEWAAVSKRRAELNAQLKDIDAAISLQRQNDPNYLGMLPATNPSSLAPSTPTGYFHMGVWRNVYIHSKAGTTDQFQSESITIPMFPRPGLGTSVQQSQTSNLLMTRATIESELAELPTSESIEQSRRRSIAEVESRRNKVKESIAHARPLVSRVVNDYQAVSRDPKAKVIVDEINRSERREIKLGPSDEFRANVRSLETIDKSLESEKEEGESQPAPSDRAGSAAAKKKS
jgi:hypothetical protein